MGNMFGDVSVWAVPFATFGLVFHMWPVVLAAPLQKRKPVLGEFFTLWCVLFVIRVFTAFDPQPLLDTIVWSDPLRTSSFLFAGMVLVSCIVVRRLIYTTKRL